MSDWQKVTVGNSWNYKELGKDAEFIGIYLSKEEGIGQNNSTLYHFRTNEGEFVDVWGTSVLDVRFKNLQYGEEVKIVYLGLLPSEKRKGKTYHNFEVYHRMQEMKKVTTEYGED